MLLKLSMKTHWNENTLKWKHNETQWKHVEKNPTQVIINKVHLKRKYKIFLIVHKKNTTKNARKEKTGSYWSRL